MRNLRTPLFDPLPPDPETRRILDFWKHEVEKLCSENILHWAVETYGTGIAFASSWDDGDAVVCSMLEKLSFSFPIVDNIHNLLLPETWAPLTPKEAENKVFDGRTASTALWSRFTTEHFCKRQESTIRRHPVWIVAARRDQEPGLERMPILSWIERFGVLRIAPLARWRQCGIQEKLRRDAVSCGPLLDRDAAHPKEKLPAGYYDAHDSGFPRDEMNTLLAAVE